LKIKLDISRLQNDSIKHSGDIKTGLADTSGAEVNVDKFAEIRKMIDEQYKKKKNDEK
jgi:hypothetical protein